MGILGEIERVISAGDRGLEIAQDGVHGPELLERGAGLAATGDFAVMDGTSALRGAEAAQAIGDHRQGQDEGTVEEVRYRFLGEGQRGEAGQHRLAALGGLHRRDEGDLVLRSSSGLAPGALAPEVGIVDLDPAGELAAPLPQAHHFHELVLHQQRALVANPEVALQFQGREVVLGLGEQVHGQEPARERQLGGLEHRAADEAALVAMPAALPVAPAVADKAARGGAPAARTAPALLNFIDNQVRS